jgi:IS1 family transposase
MTGAAKNTVLKLLKEIGEACQKFHDKKVVNLKSRRVQCDEIWSFVYLKQKNVPEEMKGTLGVGDVWTSTAIDADSKLMISYLVGLRDVGYANEFMNDVAGRLLNRVQMTTDGLKCYLEAVEDAFGGDIDFAQLIKVYGATRPDHARYSPAKIISVEEKAVCGAPVSRDVSTSYVERSNLTVRMMNRRFTRLTNAFSKKIENHMHAFALFAMHYNFCKLHKTIRITPATEAGLTDHVWEIEELLALIG